MSTLRILEKIKKDRYKKDKVSIIKNEYTTNKIFKDLIDTCFSDMPRYVPRLPLIGDVNKNIPVGMNYSTIEKQWSRFKSAVFSEGYTVEKRKKMLIHVCESISDHEIDLLKQVISGKCKILTEKQYIEKIK